MVARRCRLSRLPKASVRRFEGKNSARPVLHRAGLMLRWLPNAARLLLYGSLLHLHSTNHLLQKTGPSGPLRRPVSGLRAGFALPRMFARGHIAPRRRWPTTEARRVSVAA